MSSINKKKLREFQEFIGYNFHNEQLLEQSLTTPQYANEEGKESYEALETLGDAVIKLIFSLKLYEEGIRDPKRITRIRQNLERNETFKMIASKMGLQKYIFASKNQQIEETKILADSFEAICGALYLDSGNNLKIVEEKIINKHFQYWEEMLDTTIFNKNKLLEFLQEKFKTSIYIELEYEKSGPEHDLRWIARNPKILRKEDQVELVKIQKNLISNDFDQKKDAEKDLYFKILKYLKTIENLPK